MLPPEFCDEVLTCSYMAVAAESESFLEKELGLVATLWSRVRLVTSVAILEKSPPSEALPDGKNDLY